MQHRLLFIEQNSIDTRVIQVPRANLNRRQAGALIEGTLPDAGDAVRDRDARQAGAVFEGPLPEAGDRIALNGGGDHQFARGVSLTQGDGDFPVSRGPRQVI